MISTWLVLTEGLDEFLEGKAYRQRGMEYTVHNEYYREKPEYSRYPLPPGMGMEAFVRNRHKGREIQTASIEAGSFHPRIWRPLIKVKETGYEKHCISAIEQMESLLGYLEELFQFVYPSSDNFSTYSSRIRHLIILAATEVEAQWKGVLVANGKAPIGRYFTTTDYVQLLEPLRLDEYSISLNRYPELPPVTPFKGWDTNSPTQSLSWYDAYNKVKHDRESHLQNANLGNALMTVLSLPVLTAAQFGHQVFHEQDVKKTFRVEKGPRWRYTDSYYQPIGEEDWEVVPYPFST